MIEADQLTRRFAGRTAVDALTFTVPRAQVVGFLGPNGAGKSTTLKMLSGFLPPTSGTARIGGKDVVEDGLEARRLIGYMPESYPVHPEMRVEEFLDFRAEIKGVRERKKAVARAMELADVSDVARRLVGELSKGYKQRVGLADAVVASPPLLILDEPTEGLDPNQILRFREVIRGLAKEHTVFLSTHILSEVEAVCSHVIIIHQGRIATQGALDDVRAELRGADRAVSFAASVPERLADAYRASTDAPAERITRALADVPGARAAKVALAEGLVRFELSVPAGAPEAVEAAVAALVREGLGVREVAPKAHSLEDVFHALTKRDEKKADGEKGAAA
ncbi:MAG: ABC transporter ATP-binding protein [Polyangiales bacterium]